MPPPGVGAGLTPSSRLQKLRSVLPTGFTAPGVATPVPHELELSVAPAVGFQPSDVHPAPAPASGQLRGVLAAVLNLPVPIRAQRLSASSDTLSPGQRITVAAAALSPGRHVVLFILQGPGYRADHLVRAGQHVAVGVIRLPDGLAPGTWYIAVEDQAGVTTDASGKVVGSAIVDIAQFSVG